MPKANFLFFAVLLTVSLAATIEAQSKWQFVTSKKIVYAKTRDAALEQAIRKWNTEDPNDDLRYHYNSVDLNGDGKTDAIVFASNDWVCGSGGCRILIFKSDGVNYSLVTEMSVSHPPVFVGTTKTKGWNDLLMEVYGGGIKPYFAVLKFDGKSYPENPTVEPALPKRNRHRFVEYLSGIEDYNSGFLLK